MKPELTAFSVFRKLKLKVVFTLRQLPSQFCPKPKKLMFKSIRTIYGLIHFVPVVPAVSL